MIKIYRKYKRKSIKRANALDNMFHNLGMLGQIFLYLIPGFLFFMVLPSCLFVVFEGWDYIGAMYYSFVTLTTIGFGDIVAGKYSFITWAFDSLQGFYWKKKQFLYLLTLIIDIVCSILPLATCLKTLPNNIPQTKWS